MGNEGLEPSCFLFFCGSDHMTLAVDCWEEDVTRDIFHINPIPLEVSSDGTLTHTHTHFQLPYPPGRRLGRKKVRAIFSQTGLRRTSHRNQHIKSELAILGGGSPFNGLTHHFHRC
jgi:hypothetical protein